MTFCSIVASLIDLAKPGAPGKAATASRKRRKDLTNGIARCFHLCFFMCWSRWGGPYGRRGIDTCALSQN